MDRDEFIITIYCLVCEHYQVIKSRYRLRRGGFAPALSDEEVITVEICGEYFKLSTDKDLFAYFLQSCDGSVTVEAQAQVLATGKSVAGRNELTADNGTVVVQGTVTPAPVAGTACDNPEPLF
jgi:hypothetical protein